MYRSHALMTVSILIWAPLSTFLAEWELPGCLNPVCVWQGRDGNVSLADVPHEIWHLHESHLHDADCKKEWICTVRIIDIYGGAFSVSYISSNSGSPFYSQHFRMNDLYRIVVNAGGEDSMNLNWIWIAVSRALYFLYELHVWQELGLVEPLGCRM